MDGRVAPVPGRFTPDGNCDGRETLEGSCDGRVPADGRVDGVLGTRPALGRVAPLYGRVLGRETLSLEGRDTDPVDGREVGRETLPEEGRE